MRRLLREVPSSLLETLMAHERVEPWGDDWDQAAMIGSISSAAGFKKVIPASELVPRLKQSEAMSDDQVYGVLESMRAAFS